MRLLLLGFHFVLFPLEVMKVKTPPKSMDVMVKIEEEGSSSLPPQLRPFDLNGDGVIDEEEERICRLAIESYFADHRINKEKVKASLKKSIQDANNSPLSEDKDTLEELKRAVSGGAPTRGSTLPAILLKALASTLEETEEESNGRVPKKKAYTWAGGSSLVTALLGIGSTLLIKFMDNKCE